MGSFMVWFRFGVAEKMKVQIKPELVSSRITRCNQIFCHRLRVERQNPRESQQGGLHKLNGLPTRACNGRHETEHTDAVADYGLYTPLS